MLPFRLPQMRRLRSTRGVTFSLLLAIALHGSMAATTIAKDTAPPPAEWKSTQQEVASLVAACEYEKAIGKLSSVITANPSFGPAYERRAWVTMDWLELRDEISLIDIPLRRRTMADPVSGLGNVEPSIEIRRAFIEDRYHQSYAPPQELKAIQQDLESCRKLMGQDFNDIALEAYMAEFVGKLDRTEELIGERCKAGTATPRENLTYSRLQRARGDLSGALASLQKAWKSPETRPQAGYHGVNVLRLMKRPEDAKALLTRWQEKGGSDPRLLCMQIASTTDADSIFKDFHGLCSIMPSEPGFHYGLATREMQFHKNTEAAMTELNRAIELQTKSILPYYARSTLWVKKDDAKSALADATSAIDLNPYFDMTYGLRAKAYRRLGDVESARRDERRQVWLKGLYDLQAKYKAHPEKEVLALDLSKHYGRGEDWKPALRILAATLKQDPKSVDALRQRCQLYLAMGNLNAALADATAAVSIAPDPGNYSLRGDVYVQRQDWDKAVQDLERAKCLDDRLEQALRQRAAWHSASGRVEPAKADKEKADRISQATFSAPQN